LVYAMNMYNKVGKDLVHPVYIIDKESFKAVKVVNSFRARIRMMEFN